jgi:hypothetical protein
VRDDAASPMTRRLGWLPTAGPWRRQREIEAEGAATLGLGRAPAKGEEPSWSSEQKQGEDGGAPWGKKAELGEPPGSRRERRQRELHG